MCFIHLYIDISNLGLTGAVMPNCQELLFLAIHNWGLYFLQVLIFTSLTNMYSSFSLPSRYSEKASLPRNICLSIFEIKVS